MGARTDLERLKLRERMMFVGDRVGGNDLPEWVAKGAQTTDGHLLMLAKANGARLATLDQYIPGAELIPDFVDTPSAPLKLANHCRCGA